MININDVKRIRKMENLYEHLKILIQSQVKMLGKVVS